MEKNGSRLKALILLCLAGWGVSFYTLWHKVSLEVKGSIGDAFCNLNENFNCDAVALSSYSEFFGISVSAWGMAFYAIFALFAFWSLSALSDKKEASISTFKWLGFLSLGSLFFSAYLAYSSFVLLATGCIMCIIIYGINIAMFLTLWKGFRASFQEKTLLFPSWLGIASIVVLALHLFTPKMIGNSMGGGQARISNNDTALYINAHLSEKKQNIIVDELPYFGGSDAAITLVEYSDFQCPWCAKSSKILPVVLKEFGDRVKIVFKNYPIDAACNEDVKHAAHPFACYAAKTATCVYKKQGNEKYIEMKQMLFENQKHFSKNNIDKWAESVSGLSKDELAACRNSAEVEQDIQRQIREAKRIGIQATPSHYLNGRYLKGALRPEILKEAVAHYLKAKN